MTNLAVKHFINVQLYYDWFSLGAFLLNLVLLKWCKKNHNICYPILEQRPSALSALTVKKRNNLFAGTYQIYIVQKVKQIVT